MPGGNPGARLLGAAAGLVLLAFIQIGTHAQAGSTTPDPDERPRATPGVPQAAAPDPPKPNPPHKPPPGWLVRNVVRWLPLVERWHPDFPELDPAWILAVIAQESQGFPEALDEADCEIGCDGVGLMQVVPRSWTGSVQQLHGPAFNVYVGMRMLSANMDRTGRNAREALAAYNCGWEGLEADRCGRHGGRAYAARVLDYWTPIFRVRLVGRAATPDRIGNWLASLGYRGGLGYWREEEVNRSLSLSRFLEHFEVKPE